MRKSTISFEDAGGTVASANEAVMRLIERPVGIGDDEVIVTCVPKGHHAELKRLTGAEPIADTGDGQRADVIITRAVYHRARTPWPYNDPEEMVRLLSGRITYQ